MAQRRGVKAGGGEADMKLGKWGSWNMYLSRSIDNLCRKVLTLISDDFAKSILNGRIV
jgi:hypothetical protein